MKYIYTTFLDYLQLHSACLQLNKSCVAVFIPVAVIYASLRILNT